jgi:hypothetical protein
MWQCVGGEIIQQRLKQSVILSIINYLNLHFLNKKGHSNDATVKYSYESKRYIYMVIQKEVYNSKSLFYKYY